VREVFLRFFPWYRAQHSATEGSILKALVLNLKWNKRIGIAHPREGLYEAIPELLKDNPDYSSEKFYTLQRRFS
jgi:hypothetical protein